MATAKAYRPIDIHTAPKGDGPWPATIPPLTAHEATRAAKRLWRFATSQTFDGPVTVTSGNRYTWTHWQGNQLALRVNPDKGWREFVHDLSHCLVSRYNPNERPHSKFHARFEAKMIREVVKRGWLNGALLPADKPDTKPAPDAAIVAALARLDTREKAWNTKAKRAATALKSIAAERRRIQRKLAKLTGA